MQIVSFDELVENKVLPYNLYDENHVKIFDAGDILTPGKILQLKELGAIYKDDVSTSGLDGYGGDNTSTGEVMDDFEIMIDNDKATYSMDDMDISNFKGTINRKAQILPDVQLKFKAFYIYILNSLNTKNVADITQMYSHLRDKIISDIITNIENVNYYSELRLVGPPDKTHALNVAVLSGVLGMKMGIKDTILSDIILGALLHDIGKTKLPKTILAQQNLTDKEQKIFQTHTKLGYKIMLEDMNLTENIALIALEHHENNNGSGYPYGKSGDYISKETKIVNVCNHFDNLVSNTTNLKIHNCHEACKIMLELGSKKFSPDALYTFTHMFSYNDIENLDEMVFQ